MSDTTEVFGLDTDEDLLKFCKRAAENEAPHLTAMEFQPKLMWLEQDGDPRLYVMPGDFLEWDERPKLAWAMKMLHSGMTGDPYIVFIFDSYHATSTTKTNGEPWERGEMERAFVFQTEDRDLVRECLSITVARHGFVGFGSIPYVRTGEGVEFQWDEVQVMREDPSNPGSGSSGSFPDMLREASVTQNIAERAREDGLDFPTFGLSETEVSMRQLCVVTKIAMQATGIPVAIPARNAEEARVLKSSFEAGDGFGVAAFSAKDGELTPLDSVGDLAEGLAKEEEG